MATSRSNIRKYEGAREHGYVLCSGHRLYWEQTGNGGSALLLLHHGLGSTRSWRRQVPTLAAAGWRVINYDRWGYGRSDPRPAFEPGFLLQDTQEAFDLLDELGVDRLSIIGHSDGGSIALLMAAQQPERIEKLVVVAAHIYYEPKMAGGLRQIAQNAERDPLKTALEHEHGARAPALVDAWVNGWLRDEARSLSMTPLLGNIQCPTLVVQGEQDEHATPQHARDIADGVQQGELWLIPGVGHMPPHEIAEQFNRRVVDFLTGAASA